MISKTILDNGIRIVTEEIRHVRSVSIGAWVRSGSRFEDGTTNGMSHFIEHMLFKGTERRNAFDIASAIDSVGGVINAFTGKELTSLYIKIPDYHTTTAIELLADIIQHSQFDVDEIEKEKSVILQEIHLLEDSPDDYIHDFFEASFWDGHALGQSILGTRGLVEGFRQEDLLTFFRDRYRPDNLILTAAGHLSHDEMVAMARQAFGTMGGVQGPEDRMTVPAVSSKVAALEKDLEQVHTIIGSLGPSVTDPNRYAALLLNAVLGGSMSSRLFQEIREKRGLAYAVHSYLTPYWDTGMLGIYVGTGEENVQQVIGLILDEMRRMCDHALSDRELASAKELIKGNFLLSMESTDNRMTRLARNEICFGRDITAEETVALIDAVGKEEVRLLALKLFDPATISLAAMGKVTERDLTLHILRG